MFLRNQKLILLLCASFLHSGTLSAQTNELGFHISPAKLAPTQFDNDTSIVKGKSPFGASTGISLAHYFKSGFGVRSGFNFGFFSSKIVTRNSSAESFGPDPYQDIYFYNSVNLEPVMRFSLKNSQFEAFGGMELRFYHNSGSKGTGGGSMSIYSYGTTNEIQSNAYGGIAYIKNFENSRKLSVGLTKNFGFDGIAYGRFTARKPNGGVYMSGFNSVTNSLALKIQYSYDLRKSTRPVPKDDGKIRHAVFGELLGTGGYASLNYDRRFKPGNDGFGFRVGIGSGPRLQDNNSGYLTIPIYPNHILGKGRSGLETAVGLTPLIAFKELQNDPQVRAYPFLHIGYRMQPLEKGLLLRIGWTPNIHDGRFDARGAGLSLGYSFK